MEIYLDRASDAQKNAEKISGTVIYMDTKFTFSVHKAFKDDNNTCFHFLLFSVISA